MNSLLLSDGYKLGHNKQYPENTTLVFSNFTPRSDKYANPQLQNKGVVVFGVQLMLQQLHEHFETYEEARLECLKKLIEINIKQ